MYNKLLHPKPPPEKDPGGTGRTTALALALVARAVAHQGCNVYGMDHIGPTFQGGQNLLKACERVVAQLGLKYVTVWHIKSDGQYDNHVRIVSDIWEK